MVRLTDDQVAARAGRITASIAPAVLGVDDWCSPFQAYQRIVGEAPGFAGDQAAADLGHLLEPVIAEMWRRVQIGPEWELEAVADTRWHPELPWLGATVDYLAHDPVTGERRILEIKSTTSRSLWGEDDTADVPEKVRVQVSVQRTVLGDRGPSHVAVLFTDGLQGLLLARAKHWRVDSTDDYDRQWGAESMAAELLSWFPDRFRHYTLPQDEHYDADVLARLCRFYTEHVEPRVPPPAPDAKTFLEPDDRQRLLIQRAAELTALAKASKTELERIKATLMAECRGWGGFQLGAVRVPWTTQRGGEVRYMREACEYLSFRGLSRLLPDAAPEPCEW